MTIADERHQRSLNHIKLMEAAGEEKVTSRRKLEQKRVAGFSDHREQQGCAATPTCLCVCLLLPIAIHPSGEGRGPGPIIALNHANPGPKSLLGLELALRLATQQAWPGPWVVEQTNVSLPHPIIGNVLTRTMMVMG